MFTSLFPNPRRISEQWDEDKAKRVIDTFLNYRRKEVQFVLLLLWTTFLLMTFSFLAVVRLAFALY